LKGGGKGSEAAGARAPQGRKRAAARPDCGDASPPPPPGRGLMAPGAANLSGPAGRAPASRARADKGAAAAAGPTHPARGLLSIRFFWRTGCSGMLSVMSAAPPALAAAPPAPPGPPPGPASAPPPAGAAPPRGRRRRQRAGRARSEGARSRAPGHARSRPRGPTDGHGRTMGPGSALRPHAPRRACHGGRPGRVRAAAAAAVSPPPARAARPPTRAHPATRPPPTPRRARARARLPNPRYPVITLTRTPRPDSHVHSHTHLSTLTPSQAFSQARFRWLSPSRTMHTPCHIRPHQNPYPQLHTAHAHTACRTHPSSTRPASHTHVPSRITVTRGHAPCSLSFSDFTHHPAPFTPSLPTWIPGVHSHLHTCLINADTRMLTRTPSFSHSIPHPPLGACTYALSSVLRPTVMTFCLLNNLRHTPDSFHICPYTLSHTMGTTHKLPKALRTGKKRE
jgi:hypothetical protein